MGVPCPVCDRPARKVTELTVADLSAIRDVGEPTEGNEVVLANALCR